MDPNQPDGFVPQPTPTVDTGEMWRELRAANWEVPLAAPTISSPHALLPVSGTFATPIPKSGHLPPPGTPVRLVGVRSKIEWAKEHILKLEVSARRFFDTNPYEVSTKRNPHTRRVTHYLTRVETVPAEISLIVGDVLHNLRSALDHLAWQLVEANGGTPTRVTAYPIMETSAKYVAKDARIIQGMSAAAVSLIDATKPYGGGNDQLWALHDLDRIDKHRLMLVVGSAYQSVNIGPLMVQSLPKADWMKNIPVLDLFLRPADRMCPLKAGHELFTTLPDAELDEKLDFRFEVAFGESGVFQGKPLVETLKQLADLVDALIVPFIPHL